ncbi:hypothetical protein GCM10018790_78070 [Kitasatospora xanthocidica]|uniref:hypothetical protein n=1 Tax=Kitasatospora xanthocidica TaxID=83382 RepID=UPI0016733F88|nr:hypothetical protein [Kitasatospora xanthocidica]GHF89071.1 hypothetical protein GCM10018790_78070 [Kitasatospora xanthocidica]
MKVLRTIRRNQVAVSYGTICLLALAAAVIEHYAPGSGLAGSARNSVIIAALAGMLQLTVRGTKWAGHRFLARLVEKVKGEVSVSTNTGPGL